MTTQKSYHQQLCRGPAGAQQLGGGDCTDNRLDPGVGLSMYAACSEVSGGCCPSAWAGFHSAGSRRVIAPQVRHVGLFSVAQ
jgi:hypothetical protein